jgi:DNA-binding transcriptional MerR regulator/uncharacterized damage-inducible protein DinB
LLRPQRTESGYRAYQERDLETLEQIVALKFLGIPLKQIGAVLNRAAELPTALRLQRAALEERHELLGRTIQAIRAAEESLASGTPAGAAILRTIIEVIEMQDGVAMMKKYYNEEAWERHRRYYEEGPSPEWRELYREGQALLGTDPSSSAAHSLTERWLDLSGRAHSGDPNAMTDSPEAWMDRTNWPPAMKERLAELKVEEVTTFLKSAKLAASREALGDDTWRRLLEAQGRIEHDHSRLWRARADLFHDIKNALGEDPGGETSKALAARWKAQLDEASGDDAAVKGVLIQGWARRRHWPVSMRWQIERLHLMSFERFQEAADFLDRAVYLQEKNEMKESDRIGVETLVAEFDEEMANTRRMLERVPDDKLGWRPHDRAATLAKLASHIAFIPNLPQLLLDMRVVDRPSDIGSKAELLERFDRSAATGRTALDSLHDERLAKQIPVTPGVSKPLAYVLRSRVMNHLIHHRGQLSTYLRALGESVPGMYGPSSDEKG